MLLPLQASFAQATVAGGEPAAPLIVDGLIQSSQRIWVIGKDGRPMLNITVQELQEMERRLHEASVLPVQLSSANLTLRVVESVVDIQARFSVESPGENIVRRFDLQMGNCQLTEVPKFETESGQNAEAENRLIPSDEGYRWLHLSGAPSKNSVRLQAKCLVSEVSDRNNVTIDLPLVTTALEVHLPPNATEERVRNEDLIETRTVDENGVHLKIRTRGGNFVLGWRQSTAPIQIAAIEAKCDTLYEPVDLLDASQFWTATSTLSIRWYGNQAKNRVQVILPLGAQWSSLPYSETVRLTTLMPGDENSVEVLEIENLDPTEYPEVELKLPWRWLPQDQQVDRFSTRLKLPVPQIVGADSSEGNIELAYPNSFQSMFQEGPGVRFVQQSRLSNLVGRQQMLFQYKGQNASLDLTFRKTQFQPIIRATYRVHFHENKLELTAWYKCTFDGINAEVGLIPGNWTIDEDSACRVVDEGLPESSETQPLSVQKLEDGGFVLSARTDDSEDEDRRTEQLWRVVAWQSYNPLENNIQLQLPRIDRGRSIGQQVIDHCSGTLLLSCDNYLLLQSDDSNSIGLLRDSDSSEYSKYSLPQYRQPIAYRFQRQGEFPTWKGHLRILPRQILAEQKSVVEFQKNRVQLKQDFDLKVTNRSLGELRVELHESATPDFATVAGYTLSFEPVDGKPETAADRRVYRLTGMPELLGNIQFSITSSIPWNANEAILTPESGAEPSVAAGQIAIPLAKLVVEDLQQSSSSRFAIVPSNDFDAKPSEPISKIDNNFFELQPDQTSLKLTVQAKVQSQSASIVTRGTWLQTILNGEERRDRFVARVKSKSKQIEVQLPEQAQLDRIAIDSRQLSSDSTPYDYSTHQVTITLPDEQEHTVEVLYVLKERLNSITTFQLEAAKVVEARAQERFYWQLVTPDIFHLGWCPRGLTAEWRWRWNIFAWHRISEDDQVSLEHQLSAAALARLPSSTNSYVMSCYEDLQSVEVWVLSRFVLWLPVGALTILLTMLLLNFQMLRSPTCLIILCALLVTIALNWPDFSVLLGQTAVAAIGLVALIWITQAAVQSRVRRRSVFSTRPITNTDISDQNHSATRSARSQGNAPNPLPVNSD